MKCVGWRFLCKQKTVFAPKTVFFRAGGHSCQGAEAPDSVCTRALLCTPRLTFAWSVCIQAL